MTNAITKPGQAKPGGAPAASATTLVPSLRDIQARMQAAIVSGDEQILSDILDNSRTGRTTLLGVYKNAYAGRLVDVLRSDYEALLAYVGDDFFRGIGLAYVAAHPSRHPNARWFGNGLATFLATSDDYSGYPVLSELAAIERALADAFDAADAPVLDISALAQHAPETWGDLRFTPHPSAKRLPLATNAFAIWKAIKDDVEVPPHGPAQDDAATLIVWRREATPFARLASPEEAMMWTEAAKGVSFGVLCEMAATFDDPETAPIRAAQYLQGWLVSGMLSAATTEKPKRAKRGSSDKRIYADATVPGAPRSKA